MTSISTCIKKAGKALNKNDAVSIREIYADYIDNGEPGDLAAKHAISDYRGVLLSEQAALFDSVKAAGGDISELTGKIKLALPNKDETIVRQLSVSEHIASGKKLAGAPKKPTTHTFATFLSERAKKLNRGKTVSNLLITPIFST